MLPERFFHPLALDEFLDEDHGLDEDDDLDEGYGYDLDPEDVRQVIMEALLDPRAQGDKRVLHYARENLQFYDDHEHPAAAEMLTKVIEAHPGERFALGALRASLREDAVRTLEELAELHRELTLLPPERRDLRFYYFAPSVLAEAAQDDERAGDLADEGIELARSLDRAQAADMIISRSPAQRHKGRAAEIFKKHLEGLREYLETTRTGHAEGAPERPSGSTPGA
ncbi:hypothetical protein [Microbispora sp. NPDC049125]|uniref:hypothetical protein n=1 Tax=Microbispora sp. NPDC049125 TaxID=3154929 RepID=UPI00346669DC